MVKFMFRLLRLRTQFYGVLAIVVLILFFAAVGIFNAISPINSEWNSYQGEVAQRQTLLMEIKSQFGYGGVIHNFKNYVLRGTDKYIARLQKGFSRLDNLVQQYNALTKNSLEEQQALASIKLVAQKYRNQLQFIKQMVQEGILGQAELEKLESNLWQRYENGYQKMLSLSESGDRTAFSGSTAVAQPEYSHAPVPTGIDSDMLQTIGRKLTQIPDTFHVHPTLAKRFIPRRAKALDSGEGFDWAFAESLAFGSLLLEGTHVRLSGQDVERGTFSQRHSVLYDHETRQIASAQQEFPQHYPQPGWVEHDPEDIWRSVEAVVREAIADIDASDISGIGITNQRETTVIWDRASGRPIHNAIVWQDRRTADRCDELRSRGAEPDVTAKTLI